MKFPDIDYDYWSAHWTETIGQKAVYMNKNMRKFLDFEGSINECLEEIKKIIFAEKVEKTEVLRAVDLIYAWGGPSGRLFYAESISKSSPREKLAGETVFSDYMKGVSLAKKGNTKSIEAFKHIEGIGPSYGSKHAHFWSLKSKNPLIIIDSKIAGSLGYSALESLENSVNYEQIIRSFSIKSEQEFQDNDPVKIERALFSFHNHYFKNDNSGWKNRSEGKDFNEAQKIAEKLFG